MPEEWKGIADTWDYTTKDARDDRSALDNLASLEVPSSNPPTTAGETSSFLLVVKNIDSLTARQNYEGVHQENKQTRLTRALKQVLPTEMTGLMTGFVPCSLTETEETRRLEYRIDDESECHFVDVDSNITAGQFSERLEEQVDCKSYNLKLRWSQSASTDGSDGSDGSSSQAGCEEFLQPWQRLFQDDEKGKVLIVKRQRYLWQDHINEWLNSSSPCKKDAAMFLLSLANRPLKEATDTTWAWTSEFGEIMELFTILVGYNDRSASSRGCGTQGTDKTNQDEEHFQQVFEVIAEAAKKPDASCKSILRTLKRF
jgi:hypothetical protein